MTIKYSIDPVSVGEASKLKVWLASAEAQLFRDCVAASMHQHFFDAINIKCRPSESAIDRSKIEHLASVEESKGEELQYFLEVFERLAQPAQGFHKLKVHI